MNKKLLPIIICLTPLLLANAPAPDTKVSYEETFLLSKEEFTLSDNILSFNFTNSSKYYITSLKLNDNYIFDFYYFGMIIPSSKTTSIQVNNFQEKIKDNNEVKVLGKDFSISFSKVSNININSANYDSDTNLTTLSITYDFTYLDNISLQGIYFYFYLEDSNSYYASKSDLSNYKKEETTSFTSTFQFLNDVSYLKNEDLNFFIGTLDNRSNNNLLTIIIVIGVIIFVLVVSLLIFILYKISFHQKK